jgi:hypothetical protein
LIPHRHRLDEFPAGYSSASCSPAELASASPDNQILLDYGHEVLEDFSERGSEFILRVSPNGFTPVSALIGVHQRPKLLQPKFIQS